MIRAAIVRSLAGGAALVLLTAGYPSTVSVSSVASVSVSSVSSVAPDSVSSVSSVAPDSVSSVPSVAPDSVSSVPSVAPDSVSSVATQARERVLYINAYDSETHKPVTGLGVRDFVIREDGREREVLRVTPATSRMPVALLIDNTQAATSAIADIRLAVTNFITAAEGLGPIALVGFADRPTILTDYTTTVKTLQSGVGRIFAMPASGATLLDAIRDTARGLGRREEDRAAMIVLTTEGREFSTLHYRQVLDALRDSGAQLHAVVLTNPASSLTSDEARNRAFVLDVGPKQSGGLRWDVLATSAFENQLRELAGVLKSQYRVVYARPESLIPPERTEISSARPGVEAHGGPARGQAAK
jgi:Ca-activated chloride channel family protein